MSTDGSSLPFPLSVAYYHVNLFSEHVVQMIDGLYEVWEDSQVSFQDPDTSSINSSPSSIPSDTGAFHSQVQSTLSDILNGNLKPPNVEGVNEGTNEGTNSSPTTPDLPSSFSDAFNAFTSAINFTEDGWWISLIIFFHVVTFLVILSSRKRSNFQVFTFVVLAAITRGTEYINKYFRDCYVTSGVPIVGGCLIGSFSSQNYFDERGVFASVFWGGPMLVNLCALVFNMLWEAKELLIEVKTIEVKRKREMREKEGKKKENGKKKKNKNKND
ncbi:hypothetical protein TrVE_jg6940 [Triparma verrucosa]|uniref:Transmembrane protein 18 n=1 Tax=Triparma verrucosa TaxID=1606542 RepID=A0A9W7CBJ7_9STRA|nr:hypothetical protein TrVE_jg6940 [Triparma verrucosa]